MPAAPRSSTPRTPFGAGTQPLRSVAALSGEDPAQRKSEEIDSKTGKPKGWRKWKKRLSRVFRGKSRSKSKPGAPTHTINDATHRDSPAQPEDSDEEACGGDWRRSDVHGRVDEDLDDSDEDARYSSEGERHRVQSSDSIRNPHVAQATKNQRHSDVDDRFDCEDDPDAANSSLDVERTRYKDDGRHSNSCDDTRSACQEHESVGVGDTKLNAEVRANRFGSESDSLHAEDEEDDTNRSPYSVADRGHIDRHATFRGYDATVVDESEIQDDTETAMVDLDVDASARESGDGSITDFTVVSPGDDQQSSDVCTCDELNALTESFSTIHEEEVDLERESMKEIGPESMGSELSGSRCDPVAETEEDNNSEIFDDERIESILARAPPDLPLLRCIGEWYVEAYSTESIPTDWRLFFLCVDRQRWELAQLQAEKLYRVLHHYAGPEFREFADARLAGLPVIIWGVTESGVDEEQVHMDILALLESTDEDEDGTHEAHEEGHEDHQAIDPADGEVEDCTCAPETSTHPQHRDHYDGEYDDDDGNDIESTLFERI